MKKIVVGLIAILSIGAVVGTSVAVTYATSYYTPEPETYTFDGSSENITTFSIAHYFRGGQGTSEDPFLISSPIEMRNFAKLQNSGLITSSYYYKLFNSFNWTGAAMEPIGTSTYPFAGKFVGNSKTISGLAVSANQTSVGVFGVVSGADIHDFVLSGPSITCLKASSYAGFVCGTASTATTITNVYVCGGSQGFAHRAKMIAGASGSITVTAPYLVGQTANFTVTTSGFVTSVDSTTTYVSRETGDASFTISSGTTKTFYTKSTGIQVG